MYEQAAEVYNAIGDTENVQKATYLWAEQLEQDGKAVEASAAWLSVPNYKDSRERNYQMGLSLVETDPKTACIVLGGDIDYSDAKDALYDIATAANTAENYGLAVQAYTTVGEYKDSALKLTMVTYAWGGQLFDNGEYDRAAEVFTSMGDFSDAPTRAQESAYKAAMEQLDAGEYADAKARFIALSDYSDSATQAKEADYRAAAKLMAAGDYAGAQTSFEALGNYSDSADQAKECRYQQAVILKKNGQYTESAGMFENLGEYSESAAQAKACRYAQASEAVANGELDNAITLYTNLGAYEDSVEKLAACYHTRAEAKEAEGDYAGAYDLYVLAKDDEKSNEMAYNIAIAKTDAGDYPAAITWFDKANAYGDTVSQLLTIGEYYYTTQQYEDAEKVYVLCRSEPTAQQRLYELGEYYSLAGDKDTALRLYQEAGDFEDAGDKASAIIYDQAWAAKNAGIYTDAEALFRQIPDNKDSTEQIEETAAAAYREQFEVGKIVTFGKYGNEAIEWQVLENDGESATMIAVKGLDAKPYNKERTSVTWETCTLRKWLNGEFLNAAFTAEEQAKLNTVTVTADKNPEYSTNPGNDTQDKVWLLSIPEVEKYFRTYESRICYPTQKAKYDGADTNRSGACWWWLRSPGSSRSYAAYVSCVGSVNRSSNRVYLDDGVVRPAVSLQLS